MPARDRRASPCSPAPWVRRALLAAGLAALPAACSDGREGAYFGTTERGDRDTRTLYINGTGEPGSLDPSQSESSITARHIAHLFEGLTTYGPTDLRPVQGVARAWERSDDGLVLRFHLRPEARWSDGRAVRAHDFEYAWRRALSPETAAPAASDLYVLRNARPLHESRLRVAAADIDVRASPGGPPTGARIERGAAVVVVERVPAGDGHGAEVLVARHAGRPTFLPATGGPAGGANESVPLGYVREAALERDDTLLGVRAVDALTLDVALERPTAHLLALLCTPAFAPVRRDVIEPFDRRGEIERWTRPEHIVVNGPYTLNTWKFGYEITMKVNPHYWAKDTLRIHRVVWPEVPHGHTALLLYRTSELDALGGYTPIPAEYVRRLEPLRDFVRYPLLGIAWYRLNTRAPPVDDARVRHALDMALDRQALLDTGLVVGMQVARHYVPDITGGGYAEQVEADRAAGADPFAARVHDPARARALLAEAGYPVLEEDGELRAKGFPPLEILHTGVNEQSRKVAIAVQAMWREHLGVAVTLRGEEWKVLIKTVRDGQFQIAGGGWMADYNHPQTFFEPFLSGSPANPTGWSDAALDALVARAASASDPRESARLYRQAEVRALDGMSHIPLLFAGGYTLVKPWVRGYRGNARGMELSRWLWIDPSWRERGGADPVAAAPEMPPPARLAAP